MSNNANQLADSKSPYLLQHANNPVHWMPWTSENLAKAHAQNKLIIVSIGYSACHWCHVMEHECFEDEEVAQLMNQHFVSIKVDREERPDVDQLYMSAAQLLTGRGGWPLNVICLPDGRPTYAGTYFPKNRWMSLLEQLQELFETDVSKMQTAATAIQNKMNEVMGLKAHVENLTPFDSQLMNQIIRGIDLREGGYGNAPKFPMPSIFKNLLVFNSSQNSAAANDALQLSLQKMSRGGIYDHVGGGFARYSVDNVWLVPHFEKMLYDNAQLISLYAKAFATTKDPWYSNIVQQTINFITSEWQNGIGGFYSALDADSDGEEGKYYVWSKNQIDNLLGERSEEFCKHYHVTESGNWEGKNILHLSMDDDYWGKCKPEMQLLLKEREKRTKPGLDDKTITSWNGLFITGLIDAYRFLGVEEYLRLAEQCAQFINSHLIEDGRLKRVYKHQSYIDGFLDDYAHFIQGLIGLYQVTFKVEYLSRALSLCEKTIAYFYNEEESMFNYSAESVLPNFNKDISLTDGVEPSPNSVMAKNLLELGHYFYKEDYIKKSQKMVSAVTPLILKNPAFTSNWMAVWQMMDQGISEISLTGSNIQSWHQELLRQYRPFVLLAGGNKEDMPWLNGKVSEENLIFICRDKTCSSPYDNLNQFIQKEL